MAGGTSFGQLPPAAWAIAGGAANPETTVAPSNKTASMGFITAPSLCSRGRVCLPNGESDPVFVVFAVRNKGCGAALDAANMPDRHMAQEGR